MSLQWIHPLRKTPHPPPGGRRALKRLLTVKDLVFFGIVLIQPIAPVGIFGLASEESYGHVSTTIVIAMVAMMLTAFSYGRMAALYPSAGSAYTYVGRGLGCTGALWPVGPCASITWSSP